MKEEKVEIFDLKKFLRKIGISFIVYFVFNMFILVPLINADVINFYWIIVFLFILFFYIIYAYKTSNKKILRSKLKNGDLIRDKKSNYIYQKKEEKSPLTTEAQNILTDFNNMDNLTKIKFWANMPKNKNFIDIDIKNNLPDASLELEKYNSFLNKYDLKDNNDYLNLKIKIRSIIDENIDVYYDLVKTELIKIFDEYSFNKEVIPTQILSISNQKLIDKIKKVSKLKEVSLIVDTNYLYILNNNFLYFASVLENSDSSLEDKINFLIDYGRDLYNISSNTIEKISKDDIIYYTTNGNKEVRTVITGGGMSNNIREIPAKIKQNSNSNLFLSKDAGALYSMLKDIKIDPITTKFVKSDERVVIIKTKTMDLVFKQEYHRKDLYSWLVDKMPSKDFQRLNINNTTSNLDEIKKLKELLDIDAITKEEYEIKKKELLK